MCCVVTKHGHHAMFTNNIIPEITTFLGYFQDQKDNQKFSKYYSPLYLFSLRDSSQNEEKIIPKNQRHDKANTQKIRLFLY